jgi:phosphoglycerate dehydrogenase-like enzyme
MVDSDVVITNTSGAFDAAMGEHALALILGYARGIAAHDRFRKDRVWSREKVAVSLIHEQTACVLGMGTIGRSIARLLHHFGMHVIGVDAQVTAAPEGVDRLVGPDGMLDAAAEADVVVVALPVTRETQGLVDAAWFDRMKETALIVNIARGPIINESDLIRALESGQIAGAALDVYEQEPLPQDSPLWDMPNVVMTPHIASRSEEGDRNLQKIFVENLRRYVSGEPLLNVVDKRKGYVVQQG